MKEMSLDEALKSISDEKARKIIESHLEIDYQTGVLNRRGFEKQILRAKSRKEREDQAFSLAFADLYHLSEYNKTSYEAGDQALQQLANILQKTSRPTDSVARLGAKSDEFRILLPGLSKEDHRIYIARMKAELLLAPRVLTHIPFMAYWGIAEYEGNIQETYAEIDRQLRREKQIFSNF